MKTLGNIIHHKKYPLRIFDSNGEEIYWENDYRYWYEREFDSNGGQKYYTDSEGFWAKREFDSKGNEIYYEDSDGHIINFRP